MRMMPGGGDHWRQQSCPLFASLHPPSLTERLCGRLRPLVTELRPLTRLNIWPKRRSGRCGLALCVAMLFFFIVVTYISPSHLGTGTWFYAFGAGRGPAGNEGYCHLRCPRLRPTDKAWTPRAVVTEFACKAVVQLPVSCPANKTTSELLRMPPTRFLPNFRTPCWYEALPKDADPNVNPYGHNLYACFSEGVRRDALDMASVWLARSRTERDPKRLRCLPYFYIAGMPKSGSTDLFRKVTLHPDVVRPPMKEPHYWSRNRFGMKLNYSSLIPLSDYVDLFDKAALQIEERTVSSGDVADAGTTQDSSTVYHHVITGDASASTFWGNDNWWRLPENCGRTEPLFTNAHYIRRLTPDARIIVIIRNPTERLYSDYLYFQKTNKSVSHFHQEVLLSIEKFKACEAVHSLRTCLYDIHVANGVKVRLRIGLYHVYVEEWLKVFPAEQVLIIRTEDYAANLKLSVRRVYRFLGLRELTADEEERVLESPIANTRKMKDKKLGPMWEETRRLLQDFYRPYNQRLAQILQDEKFLWNDFTVATQEGPTGGTEDAEGGDSHDNTMDTNHEHAAGRASDDADDARARLGPGDDDGTGNDVSDDAIDDADDEQGTEDPGDTTEPPYDEEYSDSDYGYGEGEGDSGYEEEYVDEEEEDKVTRHH